MMTRFKYLNVNPNNMVEGDCVVRAISFASNLPYKVVEHKLALTGELFDCDCLCKFCYSHFIRDYLGYREMNCDRLSVDEFARQHPVGTYLIRVPNHLTCVKDGICYDIWDCLDQECDTCWKVP